MIVMAEYKNGEIEFSTGNIRKFDVLEEKRPYKGAWQGKKSDTDLLTEGVSMKYGNTE